MLRLAGAFLVTQCWIFSIAWSQDVSARLEVAYLKDAVEHRKSIKSAHGKFSVRKVSKTELDAEPKTTFQATFELYFDAPRYHLIADGVERLPRPKLKRQHIFYDGTELITIEIDHADCVSGVIEFWREFSFQKIGFPLDDPLFLDIQFNEQLKANQGKLTAKPLKSGGFMATITNESTVNELVAVKNAEIFEFVKIDLLESNDFYVGKSGPLRYLRNVKQTYPSQLIIQRIETNFAWDETGEVPFIRNMSHVDARTVSSSDSVSNSMSRVDVEFESLDLNVPIKAALLSLKSAGIPVGSRILHGGLQVRGKPVYRVFDGTDLVKAE